MGALTLVAEKPKPKPKPVAGWPASNALEALTGAFIVGEFHFRRGRERRRWLDEVKPKADALHAKVFDRPDLAAHPKWQMAKDRLDALERDMIVADGERRTCEGRAADHRGQCLSLWLRMTDTERAVVEREWRTGAATGEQFTRWLDGIWALDGGTVGGLECPF